MGFQVIYMTCLYALPVLQEPRQKIIDVDTCIQMLSIVMTNQAHLQPFIDFLQHQKEYKFINNDQWMGFYRFSLEVNCGLCTDMTLSSSV